MPLNTLFNPDNIILSYHIYTLKFLVSHDSTLSWLKTISFTKYLSFNIPDDNSPQKYLKNSLFQICSSLSSCCTICFSALMYLLLLFLFCLMVKLITLNPMTFQSIQSTKPSNSHIVAYIK